MTLKALVIGSDRFKAEKEAAIVTLQGFGCEVAHNCEMWERTNSDREALNFIHTADFIYAVTGNQNERHIGVVTTYFMGAAKMVNCPVFVSHPPHEADYLNVIDEVKAPCDVVKLFAKEEYSNYEISVMRGEENYHWRILGGLISPEMSYGENSDINTAFKIAEKRIDGFIS